MMRMHGLYIQFNKFMKERINTHWSEIKTVDKIRSRSLVLFISNCLFFFSVWLAIDVLSTKDPIHKNDKHAILLTINS